MTLALAAGYIFSVGAVYYAFVRWYRSSKSRAFAAESVPSEWFEDGHPAREEYFKLYDSMPDEMGPADIKKLKTALLKRSRHLTVLLRNGAIGDDLWNEFNDAETAVNLEINECIREAEDLQRGWGKTVFNEAAQAVQAEVQREAEEQQRQAMEQQRRAMEQQRAMQQMQQAASDSDVEEIEAEQKPKQVVQRRGSKSKGARRA
ncbi:Pre protein translocase subunit Sec66-domain-containing protein [Catenaria anguillulae PL171]|uniref:Pre protein translocase subunit Sec66-domain-containing protein n=1 Tax=Catenaria anguillulae PL171 TaxID=765915 RepID=A0A1Y2HC06_9FUNG|nr:Pre protein translocase subunit Sec66-domain-containing protein [Catenaria anguillulae PL171]